MKKIAYTVKKWYFYWYSFKMVRQKVLYSV